MAKKKYIQLPKGYLSYSQITLWQTNPDLYKKVYFDGRDELRMTNRAMEYGKVVADSLEKQQETGDILTDSATLLLPKYDIADQEFEAELKTKSGWVKVLCKPDTMDSKTYAFREYKTGVQPWTQARADNHLQLKYYAMGIYLKHGVKLSECHLDWIETINENGVIKPTGRVESFKVTLDNKCYLQTMALTSQIAKEIELAWAIHTPNPLLTWEN